MTLTVLCNGQVNRRQRQIQRTSAGPVVLLRFFPQQNFRTKNCSRKFPHGNFLNKLLRFVEAFSSTKFPYEKLLTQIYSRKFHQHQIQHFSSERQSHGRWSHAENAVVIRQTAARGRRSPFEKRGRRMRDSVKRCEKRIIGTLPSAQAVVGPFLAHSG